MSDTILIVDDEEPVRRTFQEWLARADLGCEILAASDAAEALTIANARSIDLAILDWHLGAGNHGLQLLEDLFVFNPDVVAILVTGFAHQATPLDALRMGVRDYLDKNADLNRESFLGAVRKQLDKLRPAKRQRQLQQALLNFRGAVEKLLPVVSNAAAMNDPVPITDAIRGLFEFLRQTTRARAGVLLARSYDAQRQPAEWCRAYDMDGQALDVKLVPFASSLASAVISMQEASVLGNLANGAAELGVELQPFEKSRSHVLAAPLAVSPSLAVVIELFDKEQPGQAGVGPFSEEDRRLVAAAARFGAHMLRQALAERQIHGMLLEALGAAAHASDQLGPQDAAGAPNALPEPVLDRLRASIEGASLNVIEAPETIRLAELLRDLTARHGRGAAKFAIVMLEGIDRLLRGEE
jgi:ActR/RegA family two-component response regulator